MCRILAKMSGSDIKTQVPTGMHGFPEDQIVAPLPYPKLSQARAQWDQGLSAVANEEGG